MFQILTFLICHIRQKKKEYAGQKKIEDAWDYVKLRGHTILPNLLEGDRGWKNRCRKVIENQRGEIS